jgi:uncharacterized RDD family membrane protein YckC
MERGSPPPDRPDPERPQGPETPARLPGYAPPAPSPETPPGYRGPVPPGGWQQPIAKPESGWAGQPLASWGIRLGAYIIDGLILLIPVAVLAVVIFGGTVDSDSSTGAWIGASLLYALLVAGVVMLYAPVLMIRDGDRNGQTLGKQVVGIRVVRDSGEPFGFWWAVLREVVLKQLAVNIASSIIPIIPWFLTYFWPLWDDENRTLYDMAASTHVIRA